MAQPYKRALLDQLGVGDEQDQQPTGSTMIGQEMAGPPIQNTGVFGERAGAGMPTLKPTGGDAMGIASSYDTTNQTADQRNAFQKATQDALARDAAGNQADMDFLAKNGGQWGSRQQYRPGAMPNAGDFGGVSEGGSLVPPMSPEGQVPGVGAENPAAAPDFRKLGQFADRMGPWNAGNEKFQRPWDQMSERYQILSVLSNFDPRKGITPEVVDALNKANIKGAKFSGSGDKLTVDNAGGWDRFGKGGTADVITGLKGGNGTWSPWSDPALEGQGGGAAAGGGSLPAGHNVGGYALDSALSGDPLAKIQQLIAQMSGSRPNFAALMQQLGGGG